MSLSLSVSICLCLFFPSLSLYVSLFSPPVSFYQRGTLHITIDVEFPSSLSGSAAATLATALPSNPALSSPSYNGHEARFVPRH